MDLRQFLGALRARWKFITSTFVLGVLVTLVLILSAAPQYSSSVKLFVSTPAGGSAEYAASFIVSTRVASYADLARDPSVMSRVVERLDLDMSYEELRDRTTTTVVASTQTIQLDVVADSPELAQRIADAEAEELVNLVERLEQPADPDDEPAIAARVAGDASISDEPVSPNIPIIAGVGLLLSFFIAIVGGLLRDLLDRTVKSRQDVEALTGSAVMAALPYDSKVKNEPLSAESGGPLAEAFRVLRTNLQFANLDAHRQAILVSSAVPNEGKTLVATNLALSMAQSGRSVLLIDADMRNPNVAELLGLENSVGIVTVLVGRGTAQEVTQAHDSGISFMGTGPMPPNPAEVLDTQAMRDLLMHVRKDYDAVIIDAPPMLPVADASILMTEVDGALLLVRHGSTTREQVRLAVKRIEAVGGRLFGTVLNRTPRRSGDVYGYGHGYGYGYGTPYEPPVADGGTGGKQSRQGRRAKR